VITDYASLLTEAAAEAQRRDLAAVMPTMVQRAETVIFRLMELSQLDTTATGTTSGSTIPMPGGSAIVERVSLQLNGRDLTLDFAPMAGAERYTVGTGLPQFYTVEAGAIRLLPAPAGPYAYTVHFAPNLLALSDTNTQNWLLINHQDVYLHQVCVQIGLYSEDDALVQRHTQFFNDARDAVISQDSRKRLSRRGGLQIRPRTYR